MAGRFTSGRFCPPFKREGGMTLLRRLLVALVALAIPFESVAAQDAPPGPTTRLTRTYEVANPPQGPTDVVQLVLDFARGSLTPAHTHPGPTFVTVLEGVIARRVEGTQETFQTGQGWVEPGRVHAAGNTTDAPARVLVTAVLP